MGDDRGVAMTAEDCTVMLTDIQDSTWLWEHHPDDMDVAVPDHQRLAGAAVAQRQGQVIKSTGDGILALFDEAVDAVDAAIEIQRESQVRAWPGIGELEIRIGLNSGTCKVTNGDVLGRLPNLAARLQAAGHGGQILLSGTTAEGCSGRLRPGAQLVELGRYLMRGFDEPVAVHAVVADGLRADFPPLRAAYSGFDELPPDDSELIGRDEAIEIATLRLRTHRLVTLWGPAGVGKTRLAVRVATAARRPFPDGVRFVDLAPVRHQAGVADALVAALRAQAVGAERPADTLVRALSASSVLVVLDNCEHVLDGLRPIVAAILRSCRHTRILTTSREPLAIADESLLEIRPLSVPAEGVVHIEALAESAAVRLFVTRLASSAPAFTLSATTASAVAKICRSTDGLPLAVELAAARAGVEGLGALSSRRVGPGEPANLSESLMRTVATLDDREIELFSSLAVFKGPFTRELARAVAPRSDRADGDLDRLVRTAMVQKDDDEGHYRLLVPARQFGWDRLDGDARSEASWAHARAMLAEAEATEPMMRNEHEAQAVAALRSTFADHRAALLWFVEHDALAEAARLVHALFLFCLFQPRPEGHAWAALVAERLRGDEPLAAELTGAAAIGAWFAGDTTGACATASRAIAMAEASGGSDWWARHALINALGYAGDLAAVTPHYVSFVAASRASSDPFRRTYGLGLEAVSLAMFGKREQAVHRAEQAIALARRTGNPECLHWGCYSLGRVLAAGDPIAACEAFAQAMRASQEVGSRFSVGHSLQEWVSLKRRLGERQLAVAGTLDLLDLLAVSGNRAQLSEALREAGNLLHDAGRREEAAVVLMARQGMPALPLGLTAVADDASRLGALESELDDSWGRLRVRAQALAEPELIALCREQLGRLVSGAAAA